MKGLVSVEDCDWLLLTQGLEVSGLLRGSEFFVATGVFSITGPHGIVWTCAFVCPARRLFTGKPPLPMPGGSRRRQK